MHEISMYNLFLDNKNIQKQMGEKGERAMRNILQVSQGLKNSFGKQISTLQNQDWLNRFKDNLPFPERDILICNMPETLLSEKIKRGERLTKSEVE